MRPSSVWLIRSTTTEITVNSSIYCLARSLRCLICWCLCISLEVLVKGTTVIAAAASVFSSWASLWKAAAGLSLGAVTQRWLQPSPCISAGGPCMYPDTIATHMGVRLEGCSVQAHSHSGVTYRRSFGPSNLLCRAGGALEEAPSRVDLSLSTSDGLCSDQCKAGRGGKFQKCQLCLMQNNDCIN